MSARQRSGFSLVELSIVLVILGLLTGGILGGQALIRAAELRAISTEYSRYAAAIGTFRDKYFAIPGDFSSASSFGWGSYNGDADGMIELSTTAGSNENSTFWIHLSSAGLVEGSYTNAAATSATVCGTMTAGTNIPRSKIPSGGWHALYLGNYTDTTASTVYYNANYGNTLQLGSGTTCGTATATGGIVKSEEAWNIDTKMDDGRPDLGSVLTYESQGSASAGSGCGNKAAAASGPTANSYDLTNTSQSACSLVFKSGY